MNRDLRSWKRMARRNRLSVDEEASAFRSEAGHLRVEIVEARVEIVEVLTDLHLWTVALREER